ncbi:hypothetical protein HaLaN_11702, partial [Haematococcus lacustris]
MNGLVPYDSNDGTSDETGSDSDTDGSCARKRPKVEDKIAVGYATARQSNNTGLSAHGRRQASSRSCTSAGPAHVEPQVVAHNLLAQPAEKRHSQGRVRTFPHVEGVYPTLVMVPGALMAVYG